MVFHKQRSILSLFLVMGAFAGGSLAIRDAIAQNAQDLQVSLKAFRVTTNEEKKETLVSADQVKPGDIIEYQVTYSNTSSRSLRNVQATLPIPPALEYIAETAEPAQVSASLDGKTFQTAPLMRRTPAGGQQKTEAVPLREYRFLRWTIGELGAKKAVKVSARAKILHTASRSAKSGGNK